MSKLIVGLGNPGTKYRYTRHNIGYMFLDKFARDSGIKKWKTESKFEAKYCKILRITGETFYMLKPQTFMNDSGTSVIAFAKYYDIKPEDILVIHDDLDLSFSEVKKQFDAGSAGHNGVEDIIEKLGTKSFWRIRVGIGRPSNKNIDVSDWVLSNFSTIELKSLEKLFTEIPNLLI